VIGLSFITALGQMEHAILVEEQQQGGWIYAGHQSDHIDPEGASSVHIHQ
jgi:hypothetical protein